ncbi:MAG: hypothetical protein A2298_00665 [Gammaproteobacteria bacterium RIFOXYB2_FULL_38_6]|nr:MAG: hypothetical protein A2298_00665 [Gammaproteobacteria bacterium RIFOXYB2_FULL_38_6]
MVNIFLLEVRAMIKYLLCMLLLGCSSTIFPKYKCIFNQVSLKPEHLACMKNDIRTKNLVNNLGGVKKSLEECSKCGGPYPDARKFYENMGLAFLSVAVSDNGFGGYTFYGVFEGDPNLYKIWAYDVGEGEYHVRAITPQSKIKEDLGKDKEIEDFWIKF